MITNRYSTPEMMKLWSETTKLDLWRLVETAAVEARLERSEEKDLILALLKASPAPTHQQVLDEETRSRHDVVAFLRAWRTNIAAKGASVGGDEVARRASAAVHGGLTSSDLVDSANGVLWSRSADLIGTEGRALVEEMARHALAHRATPRVGRTHGQWAEETTWGHWMADRVLLMERAVRRVEGAREGVALVKLSGPVGDYKRVTREEEEDFAKLLGLVTRSRLRASDSSLQVIARDGLAELMFACSLLAGAVAALAHEVRLGSQSEVNELHEPVGSGQIGSSSMPHKRNSVGCEQIEGLCKVVKANASIVQDGVVLWGERDINHSSVERVSVPLVLQLTHYLVRKAGWLMRGLEVNRPGMAANLEKARPVLDSGAALTWLTEQGVEPEAARDLVRLASSQAVEDEDRIEFTLPRLSRGLLKHWDPEHPDSQLLAAVNWAGLGSTLRARPGDTSHLWDRIERLANRSAPPML